MAHKFFTTEKSFGGDEIESSPRKVAFTDYEKEEEIEAATPPKSSIFEKHRGPELKSRKVKLGIPSPSAADLARMEFSESEISQFEKAFKMFDEDQNGTLDVDEISRVLKELDRPMSRDEILDLLYDVDLGDSINKDEFIQMMAGEKRFKTRDLQNDEKDMIRQIFESYDEDQKGYWSFDDFSMYFGAIEVDGYLEFSEQNFKKVNKLLGAKDLSKMGCKQLEMFYTIEDRTMASDIKDDYTRCCI